MLRWWEVISLSIEEQNCSVINHEFVEYKGKEPSYGLFEMSRTSNKCARHVLPIKT
jgi:hypothetical protein